MIVYADAACETSTKDTFGTIQEAYKTLADRHSAGTLDFPAEIRVKGGVYHVSEPLHFYGSFPVTVQPDKPGDRVIVSGGTKIGGWTKEKLNGKTVWKGVVPENVKSLPFLCSGEKILQPSVYPKKGFLRVPQRDEKIPWYGAPPADREIWFDVKEGDFNPAWYDPQNIRIQLLHLWMDENLFFDHYDAEHCRIYLTSALRCWANPENSEFCYYNVKEALSEPGEFYFDRIEHAVYYIPFPGEKEPDLEIPLNNVLVRIDSGAKWVALKNIEFCHAGGYFPQAGRDFDIRDNNYDPVENGSSEHLGFRRPLLNKDRHPQFQSGQGSVLLPGIIMADHASDCVIDGCSVYASGWYGVCIACGSRNISVKNCSIHDMGGGGIYAGGLGPGDLKRHPSEDVSHLTLCNNHIYNGGILHKSAIGILISYGRGMLIEHNHIHDLYYTGISAGWVWGYGDSATSEIRIGWNRIHDLGKSLLSDMGGVYLLGIQPGTRVYHNVIYEVNSRYYGGWGLYTDEGSSHIVLENNLVYDCACECYHQHYGRENMVRGNIFAFGHKHCAAFSQDTMRNYSFPGESHTRIMNFYDNILISDGEPFYHIANKQTIYDAEKLYTDNNVLWEVKPVEVFAMVDNDKEKVTEQDWKKHRLDIRSVKQDPGFKDVKKRDFRLKKNSILPSIGFVPWDYSKAGQEEL